MFLLATVFVVGREVGGPRSSVTFVALNAFFYSSKRLANLLLSLKKIFRGV
jgi:hypothetical protein